MAFRFGHWFPNLSLHRATGVVLKHTHACLTNFWHNLAGLGYRLSFKEEKKSKIILIRGHVWESLFWGAFGNMGFISYLCEYLPSLTDCQSGDSK